MPKFELSLANDELWNLNRLIKFLSTHQHQDIYLSVMPESHDLAECGIYDILDCFCFKSVMIETSNCLEQHDKYKFAYRAVDWFLSIDYWKNYNLGASGVWDHSKIFGVFFGRPTANRIGIAGYLFTHHRDQSQLVFAPNIYDDDNAALFELDKLFQYRQESIIDFSNMITAGYNRELQYSPFGHEYDPNHSLHELYKTIFVDIISEPSIKGSTFYPTEKFSRCVLMKKPFIIMASKDYIDYLLQMGFRTFYEYWDESYDGFAEKNRFVKILNLIDWLASKPQSEILAMYKDMQEILDHNYDLLINQAYSTNIKRI
jgi:hypothetical protein